MTMTIVKVSCGGVASNVANLKDLLARENGGCIGLYSKFFFSLSTSITSCIYNIFTHNIF